MTEHAKLNNIQALRAIAAIMVVLLHTALRAEGQGFKSFAQPFLYFGFAGVDIFFVISGFVMALTTYNHLGSRDYVVTFIQRRATRIYSNYWVILILKFGFIWLGWNAWRDGVDVLGSFLLYPQDQGNLVIAVAWTLMFELFFYLVFAMAILFPARLFIPFLASWFALVLLLNLFVFEQTANAPFIQVFYFSPFHLEFIAGCFIALLVIKQKIYYPVPAFIAGLCLFLSTAWVTRNAQLVDINDVFTRVITYGGGAALMVYGAATAETRGSMVFPQWLRPFGDASYTIYLVHGMILQAAMVLVYRPLLGGNESGFLFQGFLLLLLAFILVYSLAHYRFVEKPLLRLCNRAFSGLKPVVGTISKDHYRPS